ncbi:hypothetical protein D1AOALGA4SA_10837 [Olavius algarvensis Delta 1 endosymbiont]|nr:hypothetical protein D1AOALGA4SA_10837 [Olavius algarvensis Delta 1 endosymbiont]
MKSFGISRKKVQIASGWGQKGEGGFGIWDLAVSLRSIN